MGESCFPASECPFYFIHNPSKTKCGSTYCQHPAQHEKLLCPH